MKSASALALALGLGLFFGPGLSWLPYGALVPVESSGNRNGDSYAGQPGGTYDSAANPARTDDVVTYNPNAPLPKPVDNTLGPSGSANMPAAAR